jgi:site-specific DNA-methyltransferase (adenine-specific)
MAIGKALYSSQTEEWETPQAVFDALDAEFHFTLDAAANHTNSKCRCWLDSNDDALTKPWPGVVWLNPPYGKDMRKWMAKAKAEADAGATVVCLVPARTDTRWFHESVYGRAELRFVKGRLKFGDGNGSAPFPSLIAVFRSRGE